MDGVSGLGCPGVPRSVDKKSDSDVRVRVKLSTGGTDHRAGIVSTGGGKPPKDTEEPVSFSVVSSSHLLFQKTGSQNHNRWVNYGDAPAIHHSIVGTYQIFLVCLSASHPKIVTNKEQWVSQTVTNTEIATR